MPSCSVALLVAELEPHRPRDRLLVGLREQHGVLGGEVVREAPVERHRPVLEAVAAQVDRRSPGCPACPPVALPVRPSRMLPPPVVTFGPLLLSAARSTKASSSDRNWKKLTRPPSVTFSCARAFAPSCDRVQAGILRAGVLVVDEEAGVREEVDRVAGLAGEAEVDALQVDVVVPEHDVAPVLPDERVRHPAHVDEERAVEGELSLVRERLQLEVGEVDLDQVLAPVEVSAERLVAAAVVAGAGGELHHHPRVVVDLRCASRTAAGNARAAGCPSSRRRDRAGRRSPRSVPGNRPRTRAAPTSPAASLGLLRRRPGADVRVLLLVDHALVRAASSPAP